MLGRCASRCRVVVEGRVQGVWYRDTCRQEAARRRVGGWVRNLPDGRVEAVFEGEPDDVAALVEWAGRGPARAQVTAVTATDEPPEGEAGFAITA